MGWYGHSPVECPNCKQETACEMYRSSGLSLYSLVCTNCGLCLHAPKKQWIVQNSYIDNSIIGKDPEDLCPDEIVDDKKNENIIKKGTGL